MIPLRTIILSVDERVDGEDHGATIDAPDDETVRDAVRALDGQRHTAVSLHLMGREESCWLLVGGGPDRYALSGTVDGEATFRASVDGDAAERAALYFLDFARLDPTVRWEPLDE